MEGGVGWGAVREGGDDGELRTWHCIYVYSIESVSVSVNECNGNLHSEPSAHDFPPNHQQPDVNYIQVLEKVDFP